MRYCTAMRGTAKPARGAYGRAARALLMAAWLAGAASAACGGSDGLTPADFPVPPSTARTVGVAIAVDQDRLPISPLIYGTNQDAGQSFWTVRRNGGNRTTGYNWETNYSNAGSDYIHNSDLFSISNAGLPASAAAIPGRAVTVGHDQSLAMGAQSIITLQLAGYVAADASGPVPVADSAPSRRWNRVAFRKPSPLSTTPDITDGVVYMDEQVNLFVQRYGGAGSAGGVRFYSMDNEPALWASTHSRIHPQKVGAAELLERSIALAAAVKTVDPRAELLGPAEYGIQGYFSLQSAPDWPEVKGSAEWYLDYYLDGMKRAEQERGMRLLDLLDVHWYPEARGDNRITDRAATTPADIAARLQAPRTLWDASYRESSWVQQVLPTFLPILPRLQRSIAQHYPGTRLAITEYDFGGKATISGGIAQADVLGVFGTQGVSLATIWGLGADDLYGIAGFKLYRDYDGRRGSFGGTSVRATAADVERVSVHASIEGADASVVHLILLNKDVRDTVNARVQLTGGATYTSGTVWGFDAASAAISARAPVAAIAGNAFEYPVPPLTALHLVLR